MVGAIVIVITNQARLNKLMREKRPGAAGAAIADPAAADSGGGKGDDAVMLLLLVLLLLMMMNETMMIAMMNERMMAMSVMINYETDDNVPNDRSSTQSQHLPHLSV